MRATLRRIWRPAAGAAALLLGVGLLAPAAQAAPTGARTARSGPAASTPAPAHETPEEQALRSARSLGHAVRIEQATTPDSTVDANPDGTLTLRQNVAPVRALVGGVWKDLDATLRSTPVGIVPTVTSASLKLSNGGAGPLATMTVAGRQLQLSLPVSLPTPELSGPTATYREVLPGVDLTVTVDEQGGFSEVLVVKNRAAATDPLLRRLSLATRASGLTLHADAAGNVAALDGRGRPYVTAPAPTMWDSTRASGAAAVLRAAGPAQDASSSADAPGLGARVRSLRAKVVGSDIQLTPDTSLLDDPATVYPVYIDPTLNPTSSAGSARNSWTMVLSAFGATSYWKTSDDLKVGDQAWESPTFVARSFLTMAVPSKIYGATILGSYLDINESWSPSCTAKPVQLWWTGTISSSTTWNAQPSWTSVVDTQTAAHGFSSSCAAANIRFDTTSIMSSAAAGKWTSATLGLRAQDETDKYGWKKFKWTTASAMSTTYDHTPSTPTSLSTSPSTSCTAATPTVVGLGEVDLFAKVADPDGGNVGVNFALWKSSASSTVLASSDANSLTAVSGTSSKLVVTQQTLSTAAAGVATKFSWHVRIYDGRYWSSWSTTCNFTFDPTRPGAPTITPPTDTQIGTAASFTISAPSSGTAPTSYSYQLNGAAPVTVSASTGATTLSITPTRFTNTLTVSGLSSGGNIGDSSRLVFNSAPAATAADADFTGDGIADLLQPGGVRGLPSGVWLAQGEAGTGHSTGDGQVVPAAENVGLHGNGQGTALLPSQFDGASVLGGHFSGSGLQDVLFYYPTGAQAGGGGVVLGNGDGSAFDSQLNGNEFTISAGALTDGDGNNPTQLANAGNTSGRTGNVLPDLLAVTGTGSGSYLSFYPSGTNTGDFDFATELPTPPPVSGTTWDQWTIASAQTSSGTALYLWNSASGALYLWTGLAFDPSTATFSVGASYPVSSSFHTGQTLGLQAADIDGNGVVDLWTVASGGSVTANLVTNLSTTAAATVTPKPAQTLITSNHTWPLNDYSSSGAADVTGSVPLLAAAAGVEAASGDLFDPDVDLSGTNNLLATQHPVVTTNSDFTVSFWAKPRTLSGTVLAQLGSNTSGVMVTLDATAKAWKLTMPQSDSSTATADSDVAGAVIGSWQHVAVTWKASTGRMSVYVNGINGGQALHTSAHAWNATGVFQVGKGFNGQLAYLQEWNQTLTPDELADLSGTPGYVKFPSDDTNYASGSTWTTARGRMTFSGGLLTVTETGSGTKSVTYGSSGHPSAVLTVQNDGNVVIYPQSAHTTGTALWAAGTYPHPSDVMFLQPDGNLVVYDSDGTALWKSATNN